MADEQAQTGTETAAEVKSPLSSQSQNQGGSDQTGRQGGDASDQKLASQDTTSQNNAAARPEGIPDTYWDAEKNTLKLDPAALAKDLKERDDLKAFKAAEDVKALSRPQKPEDFKIELPSDFKAPEGVDFKFDDKDPIIAKAREWAHGAGLTQEQFQQSLGLYAAAKVGEQAQINAARQAEIGKLGSTASARVDAVIQWMTGMDVSTDKGDAKALAGMLVTARHVEAFERIITKLTSQGATPFSQRHRDTPDTGPTEEEYSKWSFDEKRTYTTTGKRPTARAN